MTHPFACKWSIGEGKKQSIVQFIPLIVELKREIQGRNIVGKSCPSGLFKEVYNIDRLDVKPL